jgi:hypothetical protein
VVARWLARMEFLSFSAKAEVTMWLQLADKQIVSEEVVLWTGRAIN